MACHSPSSALLGAAILVTPVSQGLSPAPSKYRIDRVPVSSCPAGGVPASYAGQYCLTLDHNADLCGAVPANLPCFMREGTDLSKPLYECCMYVCMFHDNQNQCALAACFCPPAVRSYSVGAAGRHELPTSS